MLIYHASKQIVVFPEIRKTKFAKDLYDVVEGPMADDTVWNYVNDFMSGAITRKQFWALAEFKHPTHQISFHTLSALACLKFVKHEVMHG